MRRRALLWSIFALACLAAARFALAPRPLALAADDKADKPAAAKDAPSGDAGASILGVLPKETTAFIRAGNMKALTEKLKASPLYALKDHPDVKSVVQKVKAETSRGLADAQKELGFDPIDLLLSMDGEWVIAIGSLDPLATAVGESLSVGQPPQNLSPEVFPVVIAADAGAAAGRVHDAFEKLFAFAEKQGAKRETVDWKGGKITRLSEPAGGKAAKGGDGSKQPGSAEKGNAGDDQGKKDGEKKDADKKDADRNDTDKKDTDKKDTDKKDDADKGDGKSATPEKEASDSAARPAEDKDDKDDKEDKDGAEDSKDSKPGKGALKEGKGTLEADDEGEKAGKEEKPAKAPVNVYFGELGGRFFFSPSRSFLEGCMRKQDAPSGDDRLVANALYQETLKATGQGDIQAFVNVKQLTTSIGNALSTTFFAFFWQKLDALIFGKTCNNAAIAFGFDERGVKETFFVHNSGASDGLLGVFRGEAFSPAPPAAVPGDAQVFTSTVFNPDQLGKIVKEIVQTAMAFQGQATDVDAMVEGQIGVKLSEIVGGLGKRIHQFGGAVKSDNPFASFNYILDLRDEAPVRKLLKKISELAQGEFQSEKFKERDVYSLDTGSFSLHTAVSDKALLVSANRADLEKAITRAAPAGGGAGLADSEDFRKLSAGVPAQVTMFGYSAPDYMKSYLSAILGGLKDLGDQDAEAVLGALGALGDVLGSSISYGVWKENGLFGDATLHFRKK